MKKRPNRKSLGKHNFSSSKNQDNTPIHFEKEKVKRRKKRKLTGR